MNSFQFRKCGARYYHRMAGALALGLLMTPAAAGPLFPLPVGQDVTLAGSSNPRTVQAAANNPAAPVTSDLGGFWFGIGGVGAAYEVGDFQAAAEQLAAERAAAQRAAERAEAEQLVYVQQTAGQSNAAKKAAARKAWLKKAATRKSAASQAATVQ